MKIREALPELVKLKGQKLSDVVNNLPQDLKTNKGQTGQILEKYLGLKLSPSHLDFEDGELKTNKTLNNKPAETIFITQIKSEIDNLLFNPLPFNQSSMYTKIRRTIIVQIEKSGDELNWSFGNVYFINLDSHKSLKEQLTRDYESICDQLRQHVSSSPDGYIHTSNGKLIQIRSKDTKPYHPIFSKKMGRDVINKNHAFYFKTKFMLEIQKSPDLYMVL